MDYEHLWHDRSDECPLHAADPVGKPLQYRPGFYSSVRVGRIGGGVDEVCEVGEEGSCWSMLVRMRTFLGYLKQPVATAEKLAGGWYRTGDIVVRRPDGDLCGRVDDMIVSGGENIHPEEVETVILMQHEAVREVAVIGIPDDQWSERGRLRGCRRGRWRYARCLVSRIVLGRLQAATRLRVSRCYIAAERGQQSAAA